RPVGLGVAPPVPADRPTRSTGGENAGRLIPGQRGRPKRFERIADDFRHGSEQFADGRPSARSDVEHVVLGGAEHGGRRGRRVRRVEEIFHRRSVSIESWPLPAAKKAEDDRDNPHFPSRILAWATRVPVSAYG